eukprot:COSAG01_NODE_6880_length_3455_cov_2.043206_2_plen_93_part_00
MAWARYLRAETHKVDIRERYTLIIDQFLRGCGLYRRSLAQQNWLMDKLETIAERIKPLKVRRAAVAPHIRRAHGLIYLTGHFSVWCPFLSRS